mmetsp:Transcript_5144/g.14509  ORF Transcript_5144/g.14509 Transcript_5144/m.14509 type:complete len:341 (-) Transcript_5144:75-1097(-)|eukprot:CAMPEP_0179215496 /NCGR_PEP_ID=MMETSP0797-20121207/2885_1 /TAXON_ID=47934 /ORGANISM="Dinophysis acuminata, Strain DAEP01" /LENGTH=340 /DNA_ID=CAMNT_0020921609 /DNA_START=72 /DNA_END=1094 /DNA_ORIENTATION=+
MSSVSVEINGLAGRVSEVTLGRDGTVGDLKRAIQESTGISRKRQRLLYRDADVRSGFTMDFLSKGFGISSAGEALTSTGARRAGGATLQMSLIQRTDEQTEAIAEIAGCDRDELLELMTDIASGDREHLLDDADVMTAAIQKNAGSMRLASQRLRCDRRFVLSQVALCGYWLNHVDDELLSDKKFVMRAVEINGYALEGAGSFRSDRDVVKAALAQTGRALEHASPELRGDRDIVRFAVKQDGHALGYAALEFKSDKELVLIAVRQDGCALQFVDESLRADEEVVYRALKYDTMAAQWVAEPLRSKGYIKRLISEEQRRHDVLLTQFLSMCQRERESDSD